MAIWTGAHLCGMAVGWLSKAHERLTLHYMESAPDARHPLRGDITFLCFAAAEAYCRVIGVPFLVLRNPLPGVVRRYEQFGFEVVPTQHGNVYYHKQLT